MDKLFVVEVKAFGKHVVERVQAHDRIQAQRKVEAKYGVEITSRPAS